MLYFPLFCKGGEIQGVKKISFNYLKTCFDFPSHKPWAKIENFSNKNCSSSNLFQKNVITYFSLPRIEAEV